MAAVVMVVVLLLAQNYDHVRFRQRLGSCSDMRRPVVVINCRPVVGTAGSGRH